jgi:hypothetical protein
MINQLSTHLDSRSLLVAGSGRMATDREAAVMIEVVQQHIAARCPPETPTDVICSFFKDNEIRQGPLMRCSNVESAHISISTVPAALTNASEHPSILGVRVYLESYLRCCRCPSGKKKEKVACMLLIAIHKPQLAAAALAALVRTGRVRIACESR